MKLAVDATPLLGQRSGVGRYLAGVLEGLQELTCAPQPLLTLFSIRGTVPPPLPPGTSMAPRRAPARLLNRMWRRMPFPPVEVLTGRVDVFHGTNFVLPPLARAAGVVTVHDLTYLRFPDTVDDQVRMYRHLVPESIRRAGQVIAVSSTMAEEIRAEYSLEEDAVTVAPLGVGAEWAKTEPLAPARRRELGLPDRYVLFTGNHEPRKNLGTLLKAHAAARAVDPDLPMLALAGPAGWGAAWADGPPDPRHVLLLGYLDDVDLRGAVSGADAVCVPSLYEGFSLPVIEAMAAGTPVLASDIPTHREVSGGLATLLPVRDVDAWAGALSRTRHAEDRSAAETQILKDHAAGYTWGACAERHLTAYRNVAMST